MQMNMPYHKCFKLSISQQIGCSGTFNTIYLLVVLLLAYPFNIALLLICWLKPHLGKSAIRCLLCTQWPFLIRSLTGQNDSWIDLARGIGIYTYSTEQHGPLQQLSLHKSSPPESPKPFSTSLFHSRWSCWNLQEGWDPFLTVKQTNWSLVLLIWQYIKRQTSSTKRRKWR